VAAIRLDGLSVWRGCFFQKCSLGSARTCQSRIREL
jgi:hypothetical protein